MATLQLAWNNSAITQFGNLLTATAMNTGFQVHTNGNNCTFDFFFTGADTVGLNGGLYGTTGSVVATLMDTSGTVINTNTPTLTSNVTTVQTINYFTGLTPATTYWLRLSYTGFGNQIVQSDALVQLSGASTTPSVSAVTGYNPAQIYAPDSAFTGPTNLVGIVGLEGQISVQPGSDSASWATYNLGLGGYAGGKIRLKGSFSAIYLRGYMASNSYIHLQSLPLNGSSGVPTHLATLNFPNTGFGVYGPWQLLANGLSTTSQIYEIVFQGENAGALISGIMTSGGTGIDLTTTSTALTRAQYLNTLGDSIVAQDYPLGIYCWLMETELISQTLNRAVLNCGVDGISMATISTTPNLISSLTNGSVPYAGIMIRGGINDINTGSPPSVATLSGYLASIIKQIRAKGGGWATCAINVEGILPMSGHTYAYINQYNKGAGGYSDTVAAFNAGTISGQSPNPDPNVFYRDVDAMQLGGATWPTGGAFDGTKFADGLHPNVTGGAIIKAFQLGYLAPLTPPVTEVTTGFAYGFGSYSADSFSGLVGGAVAATSYSLTGPSSGVVNVASTNFTVTPSGLYTGTITPASTGAGTFSPTSLTFSNSSTSQTFTYTPTSLVGSPHTISTTSSPAITNPSGIAYTVSSSAATSYTFTGPTSGQDGVAQTYTLQANGSTSAVVTPATSGGSGTFSPTTVTLNGTNPVTFSYTPSTAQTNTLSVTNGGGLSNPANITLAVYPGTKPNLTISPTGTGVSVGATTSEVGVTSFDYVQNNGAPVTGVSSPQTYTIANMALPETFKVRSRNANGTGPYATISLGGGGGSGGGRLSIGL